MPTSLISSSAGVLARQGPLLPSLSISNLTKQYGRVTAIDRASFSVRPGEILGLIGPNGSGKTTLMECIAGVLPADAGEVACGGRPLGVNGRASTMFYLPDGVAPWPSEPVRWALDFTIGFFGGDVARREDVIRQFGLDPILDMAIGALSKGQRKRALLAMSCLTPQPFLLADEPFEGLDLRQTREVAAALKTHVTAGRTLVLSIHQIGDAGRMCDRFVLLSGGRVRGEGTLDELSAVAAARGASPVEPTLEEVFLALT